MDMIQIGECLINVENITSVTKKKSKVLIAFNDRFSLLEFKNDEATMLWNLLQKEARQIQ